MTGVNKPLWRCIYIYMFSPVFIASVLIFMAVVRASNSSDNGNGENHETNKSNDASDMYISIGTI